jgi:uncharacterized protein
MRKQKAEVGKVYRTALVPELRAVNEEARTIEFIASTEAVDRYGDVIRVAGWKLDAYKKNPVFLWAHKSNEPPIGKTVDLRIETSPVPALVQRVQFADAATYPFADVIFNLYKGGFLRAVSVGFMPLEEPKILRDSTNDAMTGYEFTNQELLELSAVPVPANAEALARAVQKGVVTAAEMKSFEAAIIKLRKEDPGEPAEPAEDEPAGSAADTAEELAEQLDEIAAATAEAQKLCAVLISQLEPGTPVDEAAPAGRRRTHVQIIRNESLNSLLASLLEAPAPEIETGDEITTLEELAVAVGSGDVPGESDGDEQHPAGSRKWRNPGRLSRGR